MTNYYLGYQKKSYLYFKLCVWGFTHHLRIFHSYGNVNITCEGLNMFSYTRRWRPLNREGYLDYQTYYDTGHQFITVI